MARNEDRLVEQLEPRVLLDSVPFPDLSELVWGGNTVVRMVTDLGVIDIELYDRVGPDNASAARATGENFLNYIRGGDFDQSFFHRLAFTTDGDPFVLQGGGFLHDDEEGLFLVETDDPIDNQFDPGRSNIERSIAMAKLGGDPDSATSQFFFNLGDNSANLDFQNGGFTVFARVINDRSWQVVQDIVLLNTRDFTDQHGALNEVPVMDDSGFTEDALVDIRDIEIIKPGGSILYYTHRIYYPEGFAGPTINEFLPMLNSHERLSFYQVIARFETGVQRDLVISTGTIQGDSHGGFAIYQFARPDAWVIPTHRPYALEVLSTREMAANLSHYDFGAATGESFVAEGSTTWFFPEVRKDAANETLSDFLVWFNPTDSDVTVRTTFFLPDGTRKINVKTVEPLRRGGLNINLMDSLPDGAVSALITTDEPIVAALSHYDPPESADESPAGFTALGQEGDAASLLVVPMAATGDAAEQRVVLYNPASAINSAVVFVEVRYEDPDLPDVNTFFELVPAGRSREHNLAEFRPDLFDRDARFALAFYTQAESTPIYAWSTHLEHDDDVVEPVATTASRGYYFAEGYMHPDHAGVDVFETIAIFNPYFARYGQINTDFDVTLTFRHNDGLGLSRTVTVAGGESYFLDIHGDTELLDYISQAVNDRKFFSLEISAINPFIVQMWHWDLTLGGASPAGGFGTLGMPYEDVYRLDALPAPRSGG